jgi:hypothetical protein
VNGMMEVAVAVVRMPHSSIKLKRFAALVMRRRRLNQRVISYQAAFYSRK